MVNGAAPTFTSVAAVNIGGNGLFATYIDVDGDEVTIKASKPVLGLGDFDLVAAGGGTQVRNIDLRNNGNDISLTITAVAKDRNGDGIKEGDGFVNIGNIDATGVNLGAISITGDLGGIDAGNMTTLNSPGIKSLTVQSMGEFGTSTQDNGDLISTITGALTSLTVKGNFRGEALSVAGDVGALTIGGSMIGGGAASSGSLFIQGPLGSAEIAGSLLGGGGDHSGKIVVGGNVARLSVGGNIEGGAGKDLANLGLGQVSVAGDLGPVKITGSVIGGSGDESGKIVADGKLKSVTIGGSLIGGDGDLTGGFSRLGQISATGQMGLVKIAGDMLGTTGTLSAAIYSPTGITGATIGGSIRGGSAAGTASIQTDGRLGPVKVGGDMLGNQFGSGELLSGSGLTSVTIGGSLESGSIYSNIDDAVFGAIKIGGDLRGGQITTAGAADTEITSVTVGGSFFGTDSSLGFIKTLGRLGSLSIAGNIVGPSISGTQGSIDASAYIEGGQIGTVTVGGSIFAGTDTSSAGVLTNNAAIRAHETIGSVTIKGSIVGNASAPVRISAPGKIVAGKPFAALDSLAVGGSVTFAEILGGYGFDTVDPSLLIALSADAQIGKVTVDGDWTASSLVAGAQDDGDNGLDAFFGDGDDQKISGPGTMIDNVTFTSKIASIVIKGQTLGSVGGTDHFGFVAQEIGALTVGTVRFALTKNLPAGNPDDPNASNPLFLVGSTGDLRIHEVAL